ncbi:hypothetical protein Lesp01_68820 [Lentzea sp. NBRC 102530]|nr:hypothetical protein Lesp01_68820 [Lentzea sp. NBRC 102530]
MHSNTDFDALFVELLPRLLRRTAQLAGDRAEDVVQEVYVRFRSSPSRQRVLLAHPNPYGYALTAAVNLARSGWRAERRQVLREDVEPGSYDAGFEGRQFVAELLAHLTSTQATTLLLVDIAGHSLTEASQLLGVHKGTVQRNRMRALSRLRAVVAGHQTSR